MRLNVLSVAFAILLSYYCVRSSFHGVIPGRVRSTRTRNPYPQRRGYGFRARRFAAPRNDF
jgi:hypothetical protein